MSPMNFGLLGAGAALLQPGSNLGSGFAGFSQGLMQGNQMQAMQQRNAIMAQQAQMQAMEFQQAQALAARQAQDQQRMAEMAKRHRVTPEMQALMRGGGPTQANAQAAQSMPGGFNYEGYANDLAGINPTAALQLRKLMNETAPKKASPIVAKPGDTIVDPETYKPMFKADDKVSLNDLIIAGPNGEPTINKTVLDAKMQLAQAGRSTVTVNNAPTGYRWKDGGSAMEPIPGSEAALKHSKAQKEQEEAASKKMSSAQNSVGMANLMITEIDRATGMVGPSTTGIAGSVASRIQGTDAFNLKKSVETIKANIGFQQLQQMRLDSPTGGALGQIAVQELTYLQAALANLDTGQDAETMRRNLGVVRRHFDNWRNIVAQDAGIKNPESLGQLPPSTDGFSIKKLP
jgi:hypothetical protein